MKHHVGEIVKIREDLLDGKLYGQHVFIGDDMMECRGKCAKITEEIDDSGYIIDICEYYIWTDEMFDDDAVIESEDNVRANTVDIVFYLEHCGQRVIKNVCYGGYADHNHVFCTTVDGKNQYILPLDSIDFMIPHEVD